MKKEFHHIGIPTAEKHPGETYLPDGKLFVTDVDKSPHRIEWLRFEPGSPMPYVLKKTAHVAFIVDNLDQAIAGQQVILQPFSPMEGVRVAFVQEDEAPVEYMEIAK
jgi:hypothetical protein